MGRLFVLTGIQKQTEMAEYPDLEEELEKMAKARKPRQADYEKTVESGNTPGTQALVRTDR